MDDEYVTEFMGLLEICYNGTYHGVCTGDYDVQRVAEVACSFLGYEGSELLNFYSSKRVMILMIYYRYNYLD